MQVKVIKSDEEYRSALSEAEKLVARDPAHGSEMAERLELLTLLVEDFEERRYPFDLPDPVDAIEFRMEEQGLRQRDLIPYIGSRSRVSEVLARKRPLTLQMIRALSSGLGIPIQVLVGTYKGTVKGDKQPALDWSKFPFREMQKRGWFDSLKSRLKGTPEDVVRAYFGEAAEKAEALFRRRLRGGKLDERAYYSTLSWTARVLVRAKAMEKDLNDFDISKIDASVLRDLGRLSWLDEGPKIAQEFLGKLGIAMVVEPRLPNTIIDGASLVTESGRPVIALTLRLDRIDYFWFTLLHECAHVWKHLHTPDEAFVDRIELEDSDEIAEKEANRIARDALIPRSVWRLSEAFLSPSKESIQQLADKLHIHPAIVVGRLQRETGRYEAFRELLGQGRVRRWFPDVSFA